NPNHDATLHPVALSLCVERPATLKRDVKLLLVVYGVVMLRVMFPMRRHPNRVHANLREAKAFACKEEILTLLKRTSVTFHLVEILDCNVWHICFGNGFVLRSVRSAA